MTERREFLARIAASEEYFVNVCGSNRKGFVASLYADLLGRQASADEVEGVYIAGLTIDGVYQLLHLVLGGAVDRAAAHRLVIQSQGSASLESPAKSSTKFLLKQAGTFSATCAIGAVSTTVSLHR